MGEIIRQTFNLYNTVGLVDKDKNIYFVPHQADIYGKVTASRTKVCDCYYELFNTVSPFSSKYQNTEISQWSPEDRRLVIDGTIDDFRQSRGQGLALNYLIMNRAIYEVQGETETLKSNYYFAMFIDSVEQVGSRSVKLNVTPDYFTNFYYLNNNDTLTSTYDPFNPVMKNCFVERQHYDRFEKVNNVTSYKNLKKILGSEESFKFKYQYKSKYQHLPVGLDINETDYNNIVTSLKSITTLAGFKTFISGLSDNNKLVAISFFISYLNIIFKENVLFPVVYRDYRISDVSVCKKGYTANACRYGNVYSPLNHCVIPFVSIPYDFQNINPAWIKLMIQVTYETNILNLGYLQYKNPSDVLDYLKDIGANTYILSAYVSKYSPILFNIKHFHNISDSVVCYFRLDLSQANEITRSKDEMLDYSRTKINLTTNSFGFLPARYTGAYYKKGMMDGERAYFSLKDGVEVQGQLISYDSNEGLLFSASKFVTNVQDPTSTETHLIEMEGNITPQNYMNFFVFVLGNSEFAQNTISLSDGLSGKNVKAIYIDPLLESDPYTFLSYSINETEQIISKTRLIESYSSNSFTFKFNVYLTFNDSYKVGLIPSFKFNGEYKRYYSNGIVTVISSQMPIIEDSWLQYYIVNKAQMKNQYAVQQDRFLSQAEQQLISGAYKVGASSGRAFMKGSTNGLAGGFASGLAEAGFSTLTEIGERINIGVDNKYQKHIISISQSAKMADMGSKPDTVKLAGSDLLYEMLQNDIGFHLNEYRIDEVSYNSACKYLERFGYLVNIFDTINPFDRIGFNYVKINSFDFVEDDFVLSQEQMEAIHTIFLSGVTLLHNHAYLHNLGEVISNVSYHNYELSLS